MPRPTRRQLQSVLAHPALRSPRLAASLTRARLGHRPAGPALRAQAWSQRLPVLAEALGRPAPTPPVGGDTAELARALAGVVEAGDTAQIWLALAVLTGALPTEDTVVAVHRAGPVDGIPALAQAVAEATTVACAQPAVVVTDDVLVDVDHTVAAEFTTGIQRVVRETVGRWVQQGRCTPVAWTDGHRALRLLTAAERGALALGPATAERPAPAGAPHPPGAGTAPTAPVTVVVPRAGSYLLAELALELDRLDRVRALARFARCAAGAIGYDCVPITSAETVALGIGHFARNLAALKYLDRLTTISAAAAAEYRGWRTMLQATGLPGPQIEPILLPAQVPPPDADAAARAADVFASPGGQAPLVLVVGSHEPRKNHLAVLTAAELLWRRGATFTLAFVGGRGWGAAAFEQRVAQLQAAGRPILVPQGVPDDVLFEGYRLAHFTVFPSLNEGFGLPVAESLAAGTPAITSGFGSMREIADGGGALLVDPRDDHAIAAAMERLLHDPALVQRLREQAAARRDRTWDEYAQLVWDYLVPGPGHPARPA